MDDLNLLPLPDLYARFNRMGLISRLVELARDEDLGEQWETGDVTSRALTTTGARAQGFLVARRDGVISGLAVIPEVLHHFRADVDFHPAKGIADGSRVKVDTTIGTLVGNYRTMLSAERTILNFLGRLSGIATRTADFVAAIEGTRAKVFDTRKTTPGLRLLEKYAVRCGGGQAHRLGLWDAALIKDNHIAGVPLNDLPGVVQRAVKLAKEEALRDGLRFVELELDSLEQFECLLPSGVLGRGGVEIVLLDNMPPAELKRAVELRDSAKAQVQLEASGGITRENVREIAQTGVDRISLGALTHGATWLDIAMDVEGPQRT
jgi:nicotinate-nucleotide pyrophosphorylase (carboxylating)